ncbi:MAG: hypothetical protein ABI947_06995 [Chloroflexota bacterium]
MQRPRDKKWLILLIVLVFGALIFNPGPLFTLLQTLLMIASIGLICVLILLALQRLSK